MKTALSYPMLLLLLYIVCVTAQGRQPMLELANRYSGTDKNEYEGLAIALDAADNELLYTTPPVLVTPSISAG